MLKDFGAICNGLLLILFLYCCSKATPHSFKDIRISIVVFSIAGATSDTPG